MSTKHHCVSLHIFHTIRKKPQTLIPSVQHRNEGSSFCLYCWFFGFFAFTFFFCPFFFFVRTAFSPINAFLEHPAFLEEKVTFCLGLLAFFKLGFELGWFSFSLLTERMTLNFLPISSELFNFKARWTASVFCKNKNNNKKKPLISTRNSYVTRSVKSEFNGIWRPLLCGPSPAWAPAPHVTLRSPPQMLTATSTGSLLSS